jgi:hypothetical protein
MEVPVEFLTSETGRNGHLAALASTAVTSGTGRNGHLAALASTAVTSGGRFIIYLAERR